jgi:hypothetical protein
VASNSEFYIFRDSRRQVPARELLREFEAELRRFASRPGIDEASSLLLRAGELECGLHDAQAPEATCERTTRLTDLFASRALSLDAPAPDGRNLAATAFSILEQISDVQIVGVGVPEGFAYYALHPLDYADLITRLNFNATSALVVGIRSIGTTLSAVAAARLRQLGVAASRVTVRPTGHPYDRVCEFDATQLQAIAANVAANAEFLICDEGPGRSGSSLLSVAEALEQAGVPRSRICILCSHQPDVSNLCATDAARRWLRYRCAHAGLTQRLPADAGERFGTDGWRRRLHPAQNDWPAVWPQFERLACISADGGTSLTFEGHGHYGAAVSARNQALSDAGFSPRYLGHEAGFGKLVAVQGRVARQNDLTPQLLTHMAEYCAWRSREFGVSYVGESDLEAMARVNFEREFGVALEEFALPVEHPTVCDARMTPQAWLPAEDRRWLKLDAATRGDDHFFPGPCDIAWDLAGIIVEWELAGPAREFLLAKYQTASGDAASSRMESYALAYATFRMAWSRMAAASVGDREEEGRLMRDYRKYREFLRRTQPWRFVDGGAQEETSRASVAMNLAPGEEAQRELSLRRRSA